MTKRSDKMYKDSPHIEVDADGKKVVARGSKKAAEVDSGTADMHSHEKHALDLHHKHEKEHLELSQKHERERHELHTKHMKAHATEGGKAEPSAEKHEGGHEPKKAEHHEEKKEHKKGDK